MVNRSLLCIGAHADDIEFFAGGTCLKYRKAGYGIGYVMSTNNMSGQLHIVEENGTIRRDEVVPSEMEPIRKREAAKGAAVLGTVPVHLDHAQRHYTANDGSRRVEGYGVPPPSGVTLQKSTIMQAHEDKAAVRRVANLILEGNPEAVLTHSPATESPEHYGTAMLVTKGCRLAAEEGYRGFLLYWGEFTRDFTIFGGAFFCWESFIDISGFRKEQYDLIRCHITMVPFPERMDYLDYTPYCGCADAETFNLASFGRPLQPAGEFSGEILRNYRIQHSRPRP